MRNIGFSERLSASRLTVTVCALLFVTIMVPPVDSGVVSMIKAKKLAKVALIGAAIAPRLVIPLPPLSLPHHHHHLLPHWHHTSHVHHDWPWHEWDWSAFDHHDHHHHHFHEAFHHNVHHHAPAETFEVIEAPSDGWH